MKKKQKEVWKQSGRYLYHTKDEVTFKVMAEVGGAEFTLKSLRANLWSLDGRNSTGFRVQTRQIKGPSIHIAIEGAADWLGFNPDPYERNLTVARVGDKWIKSRVVQELTRNSQYRTVVRAFVSWCDERHIRLYSGLRREHFEAWCNHCEGAYNGWAVYHYRSKIRSMVKWASENWTDHYRDFAKGIRIPQPHKNPFEESNAWTPQEVLSFLDWLGEHPKGWQIRPAVALCGLGGLSVLEALRLTWDKVCFDGDWIEISGVTKNSHRVRRIPLPIEAWSVLKKSPKDGKVVPFDNKDTYRAAFVDLAKKWGKASMIFPSDLRDVLQTFFAVQGWEGYVLDRYIGHAAQTIRHRHYVKQDLETQLDEMRRQVTQRVDRILGEFRTEKSNQVKSA